MHRLLAAAVAVTSTLVASAVLACGGPIEPLPGYSGTAVAEGPNQVSVFTASASGYSWDRLQLPGTARTHVATISGVLTGNVETDSRVATAISSQGGSVVEITSSSVAPIGTQPEAATTLFGAALDSKLGWQVITYQPSSETLALFAEATPGAFTEVGRLAADCGSPTMLDAVVEPGDNVVGLCSGQAVEVVGGQLQLVSLPLGAMALGKASDGTAVFYGLATNGTDLRRMTRSGIGWALDATVPSSSAPEWIIPVSETSVLMKTVDGFSAHTLVNGAWEASANLDGTTAVTSAVGAPAQVFAGQYELTLYSPGATAWTTTDLGAMGVAPQNPSGAEGDPSTVGCQSGVGSSGWAMLGLAALLLTSRKPVAARPS